MSEIGFRVEVVKLGEVLVFRICVKVELVGFVVGFDIEYGEILVRVMGKNGDVVY